MKGNFRTLLRKFCLESSILGLKYFYLYPDVISRCFWSVTILSLLYLACLLTWLLYSRFNDMPTRITIENQFEPMQNLPHPSIAICSPNQITLSGMMHFKKTLVNGNVSTIDFERVLPQLLGFYELVVDKTNDDLIHLQELLELNRYSIMEVIKLLPLSCERFLKLCYLDQQWVPNCVGLFHPILTTHGLCCIFNNKYRLDEKHSRNHVVRDFTPRFIRYTSLTEGLIVVADFDPEDALNGTIIKAGAIRVSYMDWTEFPTDDEFSLVDPDAETYHLVRATYTYCSEDVEQLPPYSRNCYLENERTLEYFGQYRNSECDLLCYVRAVRAQCHCLLFFLPHVPATHACNITSIGCITDVRSKMTEWLHLDDCDCPRDCISRSYQVDMIAGNFAALPYMIENPYGGLKLNQSTSIMRFVFPNTVYNKQKQETVISLISLASNLGGVFGLCLGFSLISVLEIVFYCYICLRNKFFARVRPRIHHYDRHFYH